MSTMIDLDVMAFGNNYGEGIYEHTESICNGIVVEVEIDMRTSQPYIRMSANVIDQVYAYAHHKLPPDVRDVEHEHFKTAMDDTWIKLGEHLIEEIRDRFLMKVGAR